MNERERKEYGVVQGQLSAICKGIRIADMEKFLKMGFGANQIFDMLSATGISVAGANEGKHGRPAVWTALKRAEVDLYKQLFPTMMQKVSRAQLEVPGVAIETEGADWVEQESLDEPPNGKHSGKSLDELTGELFGDPVPELVEGEFESEPETDLEQAQPEAAEYKDNLYADLAAGLESNPNPTFATVASAAVAAGIGYKNNAHALNALMKAPLVTENNVKVTGGTRIKTETAVKLFNWLIERKETEAALDKENQDALGAE